MGKFVCDKNQSFTSHSSAEVMAHWENRGLRIRAWVVRDHQSVMSFSVTVNFDDALY